MAVGRTTKVVVRGHAAAKLIPAGIEWTDLDELSYGRAVSVKDELVRLGVEDMRIRIEAVGAREPVRPRAIDPMAAAENRRVDVILTEELVEDTNSDAYFTDPELARGG